MGSVRMYIASATAGALAAAVVTGIAFGSAPPPDPAPTVTVTATPEPTTEHLPEPTVTIEPTPEPTPTPEPDAPVEPITAAHMLSGSIRWFSKTEWRAIADSAHAPDGISHVEVKKDRVRVYYDFTVSTIGVVSATPDEQYAAAGVRVGTSVGYQYVDVYFYVGTSQTPVNPAVLNRKNANVWLVGIFQVVQDAETGE